jgi:hypothetical protein
MGETRKTYTFLVRKLLGEPRIWEDNIEKHLTVIGKLPPLRLLSAVDAETRCVSPQTHPSSRQGAFRQNIETRVAYTVNS